jgi:hypothetical protein
MVPGPGGPRVDNPGLPPALLALLMQHLGQGVSPGIHYFGPGGAGVAHPGQPRPVDTGFGPGLGHGGPTPVDTGIEQQLLAAHLANVVGNPNAGGPQTAHDFAPREQHTQVRPGAGILYTDTPGRRASVPVPHPAQSVGAHQRALLKHLIQQKLAGHGQMDA